MLAKLMPVYIVAMVSYVNNIKNHVEMIAEINDRPVSVLGIAGVIYLILLSVNN